MANTIAAAAERTRSGRPLHFGANGSGCQPEDNPAESLGFGVLEGQPRVGCHPEANVRSVRLSRIQPPSTPMLDIAFVLLVIATLLVVVGLCQPLAWYLKLPPPVLLAVVGVGLGSFPMVMSQLGWSIQTDPFADIFVSLPISSAAFIYVFLPLLVFEAGIATDVRRMIQDAAPILLLAVVATLITTAIIGFALWPISGVSLVACLLLGSVVATTDPAAVIAIF